MKKHQYDYIRKMPKVKEFIGFLDTVDKFVDNYTIYKHYLTILFK